MGLFKTERSEQNKITAVVCYCIKHEHNQHNTVKNLNKSDNKAIKGIQLEDLFTNFHTFYKRS